MPKLAPVFNDAQLDNQGAPMAGGRLYTWTAGSFTKVACFTDAEGRASHTNPIILNARGEPPAPLYLGDTLSYRLGLAPPNDLADPPQMLIRDIDVVQGVNDIGTVEISEWLPSAIVPTYLSASSFTLPGDQTTAFHSGRRVKFTVATGSAYGTILGAIFDELTTVTMQMTAGVLDAGLSAAALGILSAINSSAPQSDLDIEPPARFEYHSATECRLNRAGGAEILLLSAGVWQPRPIPSGGVSIGNGGVAANTRYYAYAAWSGTAVILELSTTAPATDAERGVRVKTGDATRRLVGMVRTNTPSQFVDSTQQRLVLSYFRRRTLTATNFLVVPGTTSSTVTVELQISLRTEFLTWAGESDIIQFNGWGYNTVKGGILNTNLTHDGIVSTIAAVAVQIAEASYPQNLSFGAAIELPEGYHYLTVAVSVSAGIGSWQAGSLWCTVRG